MFRLKLRQLTANLLTDTLKKMVRLVPKPLSLNQRERCIAYPLIAFTKS